MSITIEDINSRLAGVKLTGVFVQETLGVAPEGKDKRSVLWGDNQFAEVCDKLTNYIQSCKRGEVAPAAKPSRKSKEDKGSSDDALFGGTSAGDDPLFG